VPDGCWSDAAQASFGIDEAVQGMVILHRTQAAGKPFGMCVLELEFK
jgi:hypothetical protein